MYINPCDGGVSGIGLAVPPGVVEGAASTAGSWFDWAQDVADKFEGLFFGGSCWPGYSNQPWKYPCPNTPNYEAVARAIQRAPDSEIQKLIRFLLEAKGGRGPKSREDLLNPKCLPKWVKAILGGGDCVATKFPEAPVFFRDLVATYGAPAATEQPGDVIGELQEQQTAGASLDLGALLLAAGVGLLVVKKLGKR